MAIDMMPGFGAFTQSSASWTPANLVYPGVWYDAKDAATITEEGGNAILQWNDKSGNARHLTGSSGNPLRWNDVDTITGDGTGLSVLLTGDLYPADFLRDGVKGTLAGVVAYTSGLRVMGYKNSYSAAGGRLGFEGANRIDWGNDDTSTGTGGSVRSWSASLTTSFKVLSVRHSGTAITVRLNGTQVGSLATTAIFATPETQGKIGLFGTVDGEQSVSQIKSFLIAGDSDSTSEQKIEGYLAWRFGLEGSLDAGHPYKSAAPTL